MLFFWNIPSSLLLNIACGAYFVDVPISCYIRDSRLYLQYFHSVYCSSYLILLSFTVFFICHSMLSISMQFQMKFLAFEKFLCKKRTEEKKKTVYRNVVNGNRRKHQWRQENFWNRWLQKVTAIAGKNESNITHNDNDRIAKCILMGWMYWWECTKQHENDISYLLASCSSFF